MFKIKSEIQFDMAHYLCGYDGKCANIHGHRYKLIATLKSNTLQEDGQCRGMVEDFGVFKEALKDVSQIFDHKLLIEDNEEGNKLANLINKVHSGFEIVFVPYRTTAEEMSRDIYGRLKEKGLPIYEVELFETPNNSCIYCEE